MTGSASNWEMIDDGSWNGLAKFIRGEDDGSLSVRYEGRGTEDIIDQNKRTQNEDFDRKSDMWHVGHLTADVMMKWYTDHGVCAWNPAHMDGVKKLLNSSDYRYLKVRHIII